MSLKAEGGEGGENEKDLGEAGAFFKRFVDWNFFEAKPRTVSVKFVGSAERFSHRHRPA